jgi:phage terminase large subunit-like protein
MLEDVPGALWSRARIDELRIKADAVPPLQRIIIAIDPAVTSGEDADETGIIAAGLGSDGHGYVLDDVSAVLAPNDWAREAIALYRARRADRIVAEVNKVAKWLRRPCGSWTPAFPSRRCMPRAAK